MLRRLKNKKAQVIASEYVFIFFIVLGMVSAMTIYFRRAIQARIRDANWSMVETVRARTNGLYAGNIIYRQYEPYFLNSDSTTSFRTKDTTKLLDSRPSPTGIFKKDINQVTEVNTKAVTYPPVRGD